MPAAGIYSVTVPGCVRGWEALHAKFGRLPWPDLFKPAINYAKNGFPVAEIIAAEWKGTQHTLAADPNAQAAFLPNGHAPETAEIFQNAPYAHALELVASQGPDAFYRGAIAEAFDQNFGSSGRRDDGGGPCRLPSGMGAANLDNVSRLDDLRVASQRPRHGRA